MRIAVWNTAFLGDAVLTLPLIRVLKAAYPDSDIDFYVRGGFSSLFKAQPELANVYDFDKRGQSKGLSALLQEGRNVFSRRYDIWVDAHLSPRSSYLAWASRARERVGYTEAAASRFVFTRKTSRQFHTMPEIERLLRLAEALGVPKELLADEELCWPALQLPQSARDEAAELMQYLPEGPVIGLHPGSVWPTKRWTSQGFAAVMRRAMSAGVNVVLLAGPGETDTAAEVCRMARVRNGDIGFLNLSGKTSLLSLAGVLERLDCYVTNDSGPMHIAWALRTPVTAIFGPTVPALGFAPRGELSTLLEADVPCRPCGLHGHKVCPEGHFHCMKNVTAATVWNDVEKKLALRAERHV